MIDRPSDRSSPGSAESTSASSAPDGSLDGPSSTTPSATRSSGADGLTFGDSSTSASSPTTSNESTSSPEGSRASPFRPRAKDTLKTTRGGSGRRSLESLPMFDRDSFSWRTSPGLWGSTEEPPSETSSLTWPVSGSMLNGTISPRSTSALLTYAIASSSGHGALDDRSVRSRSRERPTLPTATASDARGSRRSTARTGEWSSNPGTTLLDAALGLDGVESIARIGPRQHRRRRTPYPTPVAADANGGRRSKGRLRPDEGGLEATILRTWPTPTAKLATAGAVELDRPGHGGPDLFSAVRADLGLEAAESDDPGLWPTATTRDWKDTGDSIANGTVDERGLLGRAVGPSKAEGALAPDWVEWLMGFPIGWTNLDVDEPVVLEGRPWPPDPHPEIPRLGRKIPRRRHRLHQLGNAVVPKVAEVVGRRLLALLPLAVDEE